MYQQCPQCGGAIIRDKDTSSGRVIREYFCAQCKWSEIEDEGVALWRVLSDANQESDKSPPDDDE